MQKSGIKSFIFSFVLTLSAVIMVDKSLPSAPKNTEQPKKISYKSIALFSDKKDDIVVASAARFSDTKFSEGASLPAAAESAPQPDTEPVYEEKTASTQEEITEIKVEDVVYNPDTAVAQIQDEYSFEELMALNNISADNENLIEDADESEKETFVAKTDIQPGNTEKYTIADTSFDESVNLWLPIEKSSAKINLAKDSDFSQVAMSDGSVMLSSVMDKEKAKKDSLGDAISVAKTAKDTNVVSASVQKDNGSPWVEIKGAKHAKNKLAATDSAEQIADSKAFSLNKISDNEEIKKVSGVLNKYPEGKPSGSVDVAYKVMDNLIIPIPEDILQDDNLTPQLISEPSDEEDTTETKKSSKKNSKTEKKKSSLFESIGSFFSSSKKKKNKGGDYEEYDLYSDDEEDDDENEDEDKAENVDNDQKENENAEDVSDSDFKQFLGNSEILPTEIKLSFQPEKAEISGSTLRWIRAFAENAKKDKNTYIEVRIDGSGAFALQQRRLNLLNGVFFENGLSSDKINTIFTSREPNSFVIRNIKSGNDKQEKEINKKKSNSYYQIW